MVLLPLHHHGVFFDTVMSKSAVPPRHPHFCTRPRRICTFARVDFLPPCHLAHVSPRGSAALRLQLRKADVQERAAFGGEDAGVPIRRELDAIALGELGPLDRIGAVQEHRADMLQDILIRLREETRQILDLDHQTRKTLRHELNQKQRIGAVKEEELGLDD